jgi:hypothetical protein
MPHTSEPFFRTFHAVRLKGFAKADTIAEVADLPQAAVNDHLVTLQARGWAMFREARQLWQLTPAGREEYCAALVADIGELQPALRWPSRTRRSGAQRALQGTVRRSGLRQPNDHSDDAYDGAVIAQLQVLDGDVAPILQEMGEVLARFAPYGPRLARTCQKVVEGETNMFTGVMCGSYHDVWMELHEDLILSQGIDRATEGSF